MRMIRSVLPTTVLLTTLVTLFAGATALRAQTLQHRKPSPDGPVAAATPAGAAEAEPRLALPTAAEGEYRWGEPGEVIELYMEQGQLRGYLTRRSARSDPGSAPLTFAFAEARTLGDQLTFSTRHIHGDWYSFTGRVVPGPAKAPREDGRYLLNGTLEVHLGPASPEDTSASDEPERRQVSLKQNASSH